MFNFLWRLIKTGRKITVGILEFYWFDDKTQEDDHKLLNVTKKGELIYEIYVTAEQLLTCMKQWLEDFDREGPDNLVEMIENTLKSEGKAQIGDIEIVVALSFISEDQESVCKVVLNKRKPGTLEYKYDSDSNETDLYRFIVMSILEYNRELIAVDREANKFKLLEV